jgi:hypothetical protein
MWRAYVNYIHDIGDGPCLQCLGYSGPRRRRHVGKADFFFQFIYQGEYMYSTLPQLSNRDLGFRLDG